MILGISVDVSDFWKIQELVKKHKNLVQHIQIYLDDSPLKHVKRTITEFYDSSISYSFHAFGNLNLADISDYLVAVHTIDALSSIGGTFVNFHVGYVSLDGQCRDTALNSSIKSTKKLCSYAYSKGIAVNLENDIQSDDGYERLGTTLSDWFSILRIDQLNFHMCYDIGHANISFGNAFMFRQMMPKIASFHIHNNDGENDLHIPFGRHGTIPLENILLELQRSNKYVILENSLDEYDIALQHLSHLL